MENQPQKQHKWAINRKKNLHNKIIAIEIIIWFNLVATRTCCKKWDWFTFRRDHKRRSVLRIPPRLEEIRQHGVLLCPFIGAIQAFQIKNIYLKNRNKVKLKNTHGKFVNHWTKLLICLQCALWNCNFQSFVKSKTCYCTARFSLFS